MATVNVLMMVDVEGALASGNLNSNIYLVDSNKYLGSYSEGKTELVTKLNTGDIIIWSVTAIDPGANVSITNFSGQAIDKQYIAPVANPLTVGVWESKFQPPGGSVGQSYQYNATLKFNGAHEMTFDPFLVVVS